MAWTHDIPHSVEHAYHDTTGAIHESLNKHELAKQEVMGYYDHLRNILDTVHYVHIFDRYLAKFVQKQP
jgi:hypothetical protein